MESKKILTCDECEQDFYGEINQRHSSECEGWLYDKSDICEHCWSPVAKCDCSHWGVSPDMEFK